MDHLSEDLAHNCRTSPRSGKFSASFPTQPTVDVQRRLPWVLRMHAELMRLQHKRDFEASSRVEEPSHGLILTPTSRRRILWDLICGMAIVCECLVIPYSIGLEVDNVQSYTLII